MTIITENLTFDLVAILASVLLGVVALIKWRLGYWSRTGLPTLNPMIPFGDSKDFMLGRISMGEQFERFYNHFKAKGYKHGGAYLGTGAFYVPVDPELVKCIMQKDFQHFMNHGSYVNEKSDPLSGHLFSLEDQKWRKMRVKLTPTFTSGKMKMMFQTLADCAVGLQDIMDKSVENHTSVDIKDILARFTTDIIGSVAFGIECNSLKDPDAEFRKYGKLVFTPDMWNRVRTMVQFLVPRSVLMAVGFKITKPAVEKFFMNVIRDTVNYREKNNIYRKDFMHLLLQLKNRGTVADDEKIKSDGASDAEGITLNELAAQSFVFFLAGFETSSTTMTFCLYELAVNTDVQDKLREEINTVLAKHSGKLTYDAIMDMTYMEQVINETLRKYPPVPVLLRACNKDYTVPNTSVRIRKGDRVAISTYGLHKDPEYYPNPDKFDPERFTEENKNSRPAFTWLPFGEGPRVCIGLRFGMLQTKVGLTTLLKNYSIKLNKKTHQPIKFEPAAFISGIEGGLWLDVEKLD